MTIGGTEAAALEYIGAGLSVIPILPDGSKKAAVKWKIWQTSVPEPERVSEWYRGNGCLGVAIVGGAVNELEVLDLETGEVFEEWKAMVEEQAPGALDLCPQVRCPDGGAHVYMRRANPESGRELAHHELDGKKTILIETRGQGHYVLAPGCPPECHPTGTCYEHIGGPAITEVRDLPPLSDEIYGIFINAARSLNRYADRKKTVHPTSRTHGDLRPGDDYSRRGPDWADVLQGWTLVRTATDGGCYWRRPGKDRDWSATTGRCSNKDGIELFYVFSSNAAPFESDRCYSKFTAYALLQHGGDWSTAARELRGRGFGDDGKKGAASAGATRHSEPPPPEPLREEALHGLAGRFVHLVEDHTEADPVALLVQFLACFGNAVGRCPHLQIESSRHGANLFVTMVGATSKARKGTSLHHVTQLFRKDEACLLWLSACTASGLSTGEGLIHAVRDPVEIRIDPKAKPKGKNAHRIRTRTDHLGRKLEIVDPGVEDKRLLPIESELGSPLKRMSREGNTLSPVLRQAWDGDTLRVLTKTNPCRATDPHVSVVAHITAEELRRLLTETESANGFGNRFLWHYVQRSKLLPLGGCLPVGELETLAQSLGHTLKAASEIGEVALSPKARKLYCEMYPDLSAARPGLLGAITARGEAHVLRLALVYALLDQSPEVRLEHLQAALAVWKHAEQSAAHVFGTALGDPVADTILDALSKNPKGLSRSDISKLFGGHRTAAEQSRALGVLVANGLARAEKKQTKGRSMELWFATE